MPSGHLLPSDPKFIKLGRIIVKIITWAGFFIYFPFFQSLNLDLVSIEFIYYNNLLDNFIKAAQVLREVHR